ncbi:glycosyltransferase family 2 protein [Streptomyces lavendulocolor]|uniref:Glycosyltransferase family 2 protein n=2 Tax=Streptomyces lavendulocolor TaxID=67316 RepID=A0ABV2W963_9ACTN
MRAGTHDGRTRLQRAVARGFDPGPEVRPPVTFVLPPGERPDSLPAGGLGVLLPTYVSRCGEEEHSAMAAHVREALAEVRAAHPDLPLTLWVGMQYGPGEYEEAVRRLRWLAGAARRGTGPATSMAPPAVAFAGLALPGPGKLRTVNAAVRAGRDRGYAGWLWIDDDVELGPRCLSRIVTRFLARGCTGAVGARLVALPRSTPSSQVMDRVSGCTVPPGACPVAGCMLVATAVVAGGIPPRRLADDGFVLFELLDPAAGDPLRDLEVLPDAYCRTYRVGGARDTLRRLRRSLYSHVTCMADYPRATAVRYFRDVLFHGLWPLAPWDARRGPVRGALRWAVKAVHFGWFCAVASGLVVRGLTHRPLRSVAWGDEGAFRRPATVRPARA